MVHLREASRHEGGDETPLTWRLLPRAQGNSATAVCAGGHTVTLAGHQIALDGTVTPSVLCSAPGCGWHEYVQLIGWVG